MLGRRRDGLDQVSGALVPGTFLQPVRHHRQPRAEPVVSQRAIDRTGQIALAE